FIRVGAAPQGVNRKRVGTFARKVAKGLTNHVFVGGLSHFGLALRASNRAELNRVTVLGNPRFMPTIALVDDDRNILTSVSIALEAEGYRIMTYTDGASALEGFKTSP